MELVLVSLAVLLSAVFAIPFCPHYAINAAHEDLEAPSNENASLFALRAER